MKQLKYLVYYFDGNKKLREPVPAYDGEAIESHTRMCRELEGDRVVVLGDVIREVKADREIDGVLSDLFTENIGGVLII